MNTKMTRLMLIGMLVTSAWVATLGSVAAHKCESYERSECNPDKCVEGEDHRHTHLRHWWEGENEMCETKSQREDDGCTVLGITLPDWVCGAAASAPSPDPAGL